MTPLEILKKARRIIANPKRFTKGTYAVDSKGEDCDPTSTRARKFCVLGACSRVAGQDIDFLNNPVYQALRDVTGTRVAHINDGPDGRRRVLKAIDAAIAKLEA